MRDDDGDSKGLADKTRVGLPSGRKRHTIVVREEWVELVDGIASQYNIPKLDVWLFLLHEGIRCYMAGAQPAVEQQRVVNRLVE